MLQSSISKRLFVASPHVASWTTDMIQLVFDVDTVRESGSVIIGQWWAMFKLPYVKP